MKITEDAMKLLPLLREEASRHRLSKKYTNDDIVAAMIVSELNGCTIENILVEGRS